MKANSPLDKFPTWLGPKASYRTWVCMLPWDDLIPHTNLSSYFWRKYQVYLENKLTAFLDLIERKGPDECWAYFGEREVTLADIKGRSVSFAPQTLAYCMSAKILPFGLNRPVLNSCGHLDCCNPDHLRLGRWENEV